MSERCTCGRLNTSSVNHRNDCPIKIEAIERLHLSPESTYVTAKDAQPKTVAATK